jgi:cation diffusion facilitator family transporter
MTSKKPSRAGTDTAGRAVLIKIASLTALAGNTILASIKIGFGLSAGSMAVVGDGIDSSVDVLIALMSLAVSRIISRPADEEHPWGHGRAETVATAFLASALFFAGGQIIINAGKNLFAGLSHDVPAPPALIAAFISVLGKAVLAWTQYYFGKRADSAMLRANAKNMTADVVLSGTVLVGLGLSMIFNLGMIDSVAALLVGFWVIKSAIGIFMETNLELMDGASGKESYRAVFEAVHSVPGAGNPHRTRMRRIAGLWDIDIDIEVNPDFTVQKAHTIASQVERAIKERVDGVYDIMVHVEPWGDQKRQKDEGFGLCEDTVNGAQNNTPGSL